MTTSPLKVIWSIKIIPVEWFCHVRNSKYTFVTYRCVYVSLCVTIIRRLFLASFSLKKKNCVHLFSLLWIIQANLWVAIFYLSFAIYLFWHSIQGLILFLFLTLNFNNLLYLQIFTEQLFVGKYYAVDYGWARQRGLYWWLRFDLGPQTSFLRE